MSPAHSRERELTQRLAEAEATIEALLSGQVDAVVDVQSHTPVLLAKAQAALRESEERYRRILETTKEGVWLTDGSGATTFMNRSMREILGCNGNACHGMRHSDFVEETDRPRLERYLAAPSATALDIQLRRGNGELVWVEFHTAPSVNHDGVVDGVLAMVTDVSERRHILDALRTAEERMRFALSFANIGIWDQDYKTGRLQWSEILEAQFGIPRGSFEGTAEAYSRLIHPEDRSEVSATIASAMQTGGEFRIRHRVVHPNGSTRVLAGSAIVLLDERGQPLRAVGIVQDVTERENLELQYQHSQKMEAVGQLAGGVAHDFNNILCVILGCGDLLLADLDPLDPSRNDAEEIVQAARRASDLTRQLLMFSRKQVLTPRVLDLAAVTQHMAGMLRRIVGEDIALQFVHDPAGGSVRADQGSIEQVILNLVVNARDAMPTGGTLTIKTRQTTIRPSTASAGRMMKVTPGRYVELVVSDSGVGMDDATQQRVFEPFFTTKPVGEGTGLGLSTVFGIVQQNQGSIRIQSAPGEGATFSVLLPLVEAPPDEISETPSAARAHGTETILLVEDEDQVRTVARMILERNGYTVIEKRTAADALLHCRHGGGHIDLLLTDVVMPVMGGPELASHIVKILPHVKVICMSGYTDDSVMRRGILKGDTAFVHKPFTVSSLTRKVREVLDTPIG